MARQPRQDFHISTLEKTAQKKDTKVSLNVPICTFTFYGEQVENNLCTAPEVRVRDLASQNMAVYKVFMV